jgi:hypothetical protein
MAVGDAIGCTGLETGDMVGAGLCRTTGTLTVLVAWTMVGVGVCWGVLAAMTVPVTAGVVVTVIVGIVVPVTTGVVVTVIVDVLVTVVAGVTLSVTVRVGVPSGLSKADDVDVA